MTGTRPALAVAYGPRSVPVMQLAEAAAGECDLIWVVDGRLPEMAHMEKLLRRFGPVVDVGGLTPDRAAKALSEHQPDGLVTYFDAGMVFLAEMAEALGLRFHSPATAEALVDKARQREVLGRAGLAMPRSWILPPGPLVQALGALPPDMTWPLVFKPRSESGSRHTFLANDHDEALALLESVGPGLEEMVVEEYIVGRPELTGGPYADYVSVESVVSSGRVYDLALTGRFPLAPTFRETGFFIPAPLGPRYREEVVDLAAAAAGALGVRDGCLHTEVKLTDSGPRIIEVNGRIGGGIPDMLERAAGFSILPLSMKVALGQAVGPLGPVDCQRVGYRFFLQPPQIVGTVTSLEGVDALADFPGMENLTVHRGPGSHVDWRDGTRTFILAAVGSASDQASVLEVDRILREEVRVGYDQSSPHQ